MGQQLGDLMHLIVLPDNPPCWPEYDPQFVRELRWNPRVGHTVNVRRAFETIDADRWYLVKNVYGHRSRLDRGGRVEGYETVFGVPRPRFGARGFFQVEQRISTDRVWHHGMTYEYAETKSGGTPIGEPEPISVEDAYRYWERIREVLRISEAELIRRGMPKPVKHVLEGRPYWWAPETTSIAAHPTRSAPELVSRFRKVARSS